MLLVTVLKFGSNWWARFGRDPQDPLRFTRHAAYFNSAGVRCNSKMRRHWIVPGLIRFNGVGGFNPQFPSRSVGATFECTDPVIARGDNRLLFGKKAPHSAVPDFYLIALSGDEYGRFNFSDLTWKSHTVLPIAVSNLRQKQEALLLMKPGDWVRTNLGVWRLKAPNAGKHAALELYREEATN
jgi:hypothetical protein